MGCRLDGRENCLGCGWLGRLCVSVGKAVGIVSEWGEVMQLGVGAAQLQGQERIR